MEETEPPKISFRKILIGAIGLVGLIAISAGIGMLQGYLHNLSLQRQSEARTKLPVQRKPDAVFVVREIPENARKEAPTKKDGALPLVAVLPSRLEIREPKRFATIRPVQQKNPQPNGGAEKLAR